MAALYMEQPEKQTKYQLRLALGAYSTSPVESLYTEANEPSLKLRREKLALQYSLKLIKSSKSSFQYYFPTTVHSFFQQKETSIKSFGLRIKMIIEEKPDKSCAE